MKSRVRTLLLAASAVGLAVAAYGFAVSPLAEAALLALDPHEPYLIAEFRLKRLPQEDYEREIRAAIAEEDFETARQILLIGQENGHLFDPALAAATEESAAARRWRNGRDFAGGFLTGNVGTLPGFAGAVASDFLVVGDLRDILREGPKALRGEDYDGFVLGLSLVGVATVVPVTGPLDLGASLLKTAKRTGRLSEGLTRSLSRSFADLVDGPALRAALSISPGGARRAAEEAAPAAGALGRRFGKVLKPEAALDLRLAAGSTAAIAGAGGMKAAARALSLAEETADLARISRLSAKAGDRTSGLLKVLGKGAYRLGKLAYLIMAAILAAAGWIWWAGSLAIRVSHGLLRRLEKLAFSRP